MRAQELMNRIFGILEILELARSGRSDFAAGRRQSLGDAVIAERTLLGSVGLGINEAASVGARLHTVAAAEAVTLVDQHHAVWRDEGRAHRADLRARGIRAVIA